MDLNLEEVLEEEGLVPDRVLQNLLIKPEEADSSGQTQPVFKAVTPHAGFCLKTQTDKEKKVFINICKSDEIPSPKDITDEQLQAVLGSGDPTRYRVPLSLGEPHTEKDNVGSQCQTYDVIIGTKFYETIQQRPVMKNFFLTVVLEGLEDKYNILLSRDCKIMKNRKFLGSMPEQTVREKPKPFIIEMDSHQENELAQRKESPMSSEPHYTIIREPVEGDLPEFLVMEVHLPGIPSSKHQVLEVGEDRLVLKTSRPNLFFLDIDLPYLVNNEETGAQFNRQNGMLTITLPVTGIGTA